MGAAGVSTQGGGCVFTCPPPRGVWDCRAAHGTKVFDAHADRVFVRDSGSHWKSRELLQGRYRSAPQRELLHRSRGTVTTEVLGSSHLLSLMPRGNNKTMPLLERCCLLSLCCSSSLGPRARPASARPRGQDHSRPRVQARRGAHVGGSPIASRYLPRACSRCPRG